MQFKDATRKSLSCVCFESASDTDVATQKRYGDAQLNFDTWMMEKSRPRVRQPRDSLYVATQKRHIDVQLNVDKGMEKSTSRDFYLGTVSLFGSTQLMNVCISVGP